MAYTHFNKTIVQIHPLMEVEQGVLCDWELSDVHSLKRHYKWVRIFDANDANMSVKNSFHFEFWWIVILYHCAL